MEEKLDLYVQKNQLLKDGILTQDEKYSKEVQELDEKYSSLEKANEELRQRQAKMSSLSGNQSDMGVHLGGKNKLLYEV